MQKRRCIYCRQWGKTTRDHVPPKCIFPKPLPTNLKTVPACKKCHDQTSKDDEYFRMMLAMSSQASEYPGADQNRDTVFRSLQKPEAKGLLRAFLANISEVEFVTPSGLYAGKGMTYHVDLPRLYKVVERTIRGLYFIETQTIFPADCTVSVYSNESFEDLPSETMKGIKETVLVPLAAKLPKSIGSIFTYRHHITEHDHCSAWALVFYGKIAFLGISMPRVPRSAATLETPAALPSASLLPP